MAVAIYGLGLPAFVLQKTLQPLFFAREDTKRPFYYALAAMVINLLLAIGLSYYIGFIAAAVGTTMTGWVMVVMLANGARTMGDAAKFDARFRKRIWRIIGASVTMGLILLISATIMSPFFGMASWRYLALLILVAIGVISYFGIGQLIGAFRLGEFRNAVRR
jgi:putative peptidoglycan lipid II flippase